MRDNVDPPSHHYHHHQHHHHHLISERRRAFPGTRKLLSAKPCIFILATALLTGTSQLISTSSEHPPAIIPSASWPKWPFAAPLEPPIYIRRSSPSFPLPANILQTFSWSSSWYSREMRTNWKPWDMSRESLIRIPPLLVCPPDDERTFVPRSEYAKYVVKHVISSGKRNPQLSHVFAYGINSSEKKWPTNPPTGLKR